MAIIVPSDIGGISSDTPHRGELETLEQLKSILPDDYTVFHSVHWSRSNPRRTSYGEIDFVVINRSGDTLIIEQKNGSVEETENGLIKRYGDSEKHVGDQVRRSLESVREKFKKQSTDRQNLKLDYLIYCPDQHLRAINGVGIDRNRIVDARGRCEIVA